MRAEFSEFSYGFSLISELASALKCTAAPILPSLSQEGKKGGGYDVKLEKPGLPLFLQFKLSEYMKSKGAKEIKNYSSSLSNPYYRFALSTVNSSQHEMLYNFAHAGNVYYCAPNFHLEADINKHWRDKNINSESVYIVPRDIGLLGDGKPHSVCFNEASIKDRFAYVFSEPKEVMAITGDELLEKLSPKISEQFAMQKPRPLRETLSEQLESIDMAIQGYRRSLTEKPRFRSGRLLNELDAQLETVDLLTQNTPEKIIDLHKIGLISAHILKTQMFLFQPLSE